MKAIYTVMCTPFPCTYYWNNTPLLYCKQKQDKNNTPLLYCKQKQDENNTPLLYCKQKQDENNTVTSPNRVL